MDDIFVTPHRPKPSVAESVSSVYTPIIFSSSDDESVVILSSDENKPSSKKNDSFLRYRDVSFGNLKNDKECCSTTIVLSSDESDSDDNIKNWKRKSKKMLQVLNDSTDESVKENEDPNIIHGIEKKIVVKKEKEVECTITDITNRVATGLCIDEKITKNPRSVKLKPLIFDSDDSEDEFPNKNLPKQVSKTTTKMFLESLSPKVPTNIANLEALKYRQDFKKHRLELTGKLFKLFNEKIFEGKLPYDMPIVWNERLLKTAGYTRCSRLKGVRYCSICLSTKVLDCASRLRDTLLHEMCHAAVWMVHGENDGHGSLWQAWAMKSSIVFPDIKVPSRCHSYVINYKFTYKCMKCGHTVGRHSRSIKINKQFCPRCHGTFQLLKNK